MSIRAALFMFSVERPGRPARRRLRAGHARTDDGGQRDQRQDDGEELLHGGDLPLLLSNAGEMRATGKGCVAMNRSDDRGSAIGGGTDDRIRRAGFHLSARASAR